mgnify:CR=1 FL=1
MWALLLGCLATDLDGDGWSTAAGDCDDNDGDVHPQADEYCNGADDDCDGHSDGPDSVDATDWYIDADGDGLAGTLTRACDAPENASLDVRDCDDGDATVYEDAPERCNERDDDCDGTVDEDAVDPRLYWEDDDGDGYGALANSTTGCSAPSGFVDNADDCDDADGDIHPDSVWYADVDRDGYGDPMTEVLSCEQPFGAVDNADDCDDEVDWKYPGAQEICNVEDDDCDETVDEDALGGWVPRDDMPWAYAQGAVATTDDWLYVLGGAVHGWPNDERKILKGDPDTLEWVVAGTMAGFSINHGVAIHDGYVYHFGTQNASWLGKVDSDGDIGDWVSGTAPPSNGENPGVAVLDGRLYVFGARSDTAAFATLNGDGSWGAWTSTTASPKPLAANRVSLVHDDRIWVVAAHESPTVALPGVFVAEAGTDGHLTWYDLGETPIRPASATRIGDLLVIAIDGDDRSVWAATMNGPSLGSWIQLEDALGPSGSMFIGGDRLLQVGGDDVSYVGGVSVWEMGVCQ